MEKILKLVRVTIFVVSTTQLITEPNRNKSQIFNTGGLSRNRFPDGLIFDTATSAYQVEVMTDKVGRELCICDTFIKVHEIASGANVSITADQSHRYKEDMDLLKSQNFDAYRFSISWSRIFPNGTGYINQEGVDYYNRLIDYMIQKGITPFANLYYYEIPQALQEKYLGWLDHQVVNDYADYVEFCFKTYGDRVKNWMTFNEPRVIAALGYNDETHALGICSKPYRDCTEGDSAIETYIVAHNLLLSHATAVQRYKEKYQEDQQGRIGILLDSVWYESLIRGKAD